jgi:AraC family transcriptional activator of pobA
MKSFRSLILKKIDIRLPGLSVLRLRLHKHLNEVDAVESHSHTFGQILCYLSNGGGLVLGNSLHEIHCGSLAWIPAGRKHAIREHPTRRPVCLAIDIRMPQPNSAKVATSTLVELSGIRKRLSELGHLRDPSSMESRLRAASSTLEILDIVFRALGFLPRESLPAPAVIRKLETLAANPKLFHVEVRGICRMAGGNPDHLNRLFKRHTGLTIQRHREAVRIELCKKELLKGRPIGRSAEACGFTDTNYFSRWFRRQTGQSPTEFLDSAIPKKTSGEAPVTPSR